MAKAARDDFSATVKRTLAKRVSGLCSRPTCRAQTGGPHFDPEKALNVGVAAHITAASPKGPRYDPALTAARRRSAHNGIWCCQTCGTLIDNDERQFPVTLLRDWKAAAEREALDRIGKAPLASPASQVIDRWVSLQYAQNAGIITRLTHEGFEHCWCSADHESERVDLEGWEPVIVDLPDGNRARLKVNDHPAIGGYLILLRRRRRP